MNGIKTCLNKTCLNKTCFKRKCEQGISYMPIALEIFLFNSSMSTENQSEYQGILHIVLHQ